MQRSIGFVFRLVCCHGVGRVLARWPALTVMRPIDNAVLNEPHESVRVRPVLKLGRAYSLAIFAPELNDCVSGVWRLPHDSDRSAELSRVIRLA